MREGGAVQQRSFQELSQETGISRATLHYRTRVKGMRIEQAIQIRPYSRETEAAGPGHPGSESWSELDWEEDPWAQEFVMFTDYDDFPDREVPYEDIAAEMGLSRESVRQDCERALRKLRLSGVQLRDFLEPHREPWHDMKRHVR